MWWVFARNFTWNRSGQIKPTDTPVHQLQTKQTLSFLVTSIHGKALTNAPTALHTAFWLFLTFSPDLWQRNMFTYILWRIIDLFCCQKGDFILIDFVLNHTFLVFLEFSWIQFSLQTLTTGPQQLLLNISNTWIRFFVCIKQHTVIKEAFSVQLHLNLANRSSVKRHVCVVHAL